MKLNLLQFIQTTVVGGALSLAAQGAPLPFDPFAQSQRVSFTYQIEVERPTAGDLRLWIPFPVNDSEQKVASYRVETTPQLSRPAELKKELRYGNQMLFFSVGREDFAPAGGLLIKVIYEIERHPVGVVAGDSAQARAQPRSFSPDVFLAENPWLKSNAQIEQMAVRATKAAPTEREKIRALYNHVYDIMTYNKDGQGWGRGDPIWACSAKRGNCTDFHSLLIAMARKVGVAGRFEIGVPIPSHLNEGEIPGYHCWARLFDKGQGWIPVDASEAKKAGARDKYFGLIPSDRVAFSVGRNITLEPAQRAEGLNFFVYPYAESAGQPYQALKPKFSFRRL